VETQTTPARRRRFRRHRFGKPVFVLQDRDREIVRLVSAHRFITSEEIQALVPGSGQVILRRLQVLFHNGFLDRPRQQRARGNAPLVYALGSKGAALLAELAGKRPAGGDWSEKNRQAGLPYIEHTLMVSRFRTALTLACRQNGKVALEDWREGAELRDEVRVEHSDWTERIPVCPDAYFTLRLAGEPKGRNRVRVFLEADRGTMTVKRFTLKTRGYWHYWRSGRQEEKFGIKNFLVLTVTATPERAANLCAATAGLDAPRHRGLRMFMFGSEQAYSLTDPLPILSGVWRSAGDSSLHSILE
jgi:hypothetical protein